MMKNNIFVLGAGIFGTAIANELAVNSRNNVLLFSRNQEKVDEINEYNTNKSCFPNKQLNKSLKATSNRELIKNAEVIFIALPSFAIIDTLNKFKRYIENNPIVVNLSKGLFSPNLTIVDEIRRALETDNVTTLKGPSFAIEIMEHAETLLTLGYSKDYQLSRIRDVFKETVIHIDSTNDIKGVEMVSVLKNIYAVFLGIVDARCDSANTRFMMLTKSFSEIRVLLKLLGGKEETLFLACGFGDLCLTSLNDLSRNRTLGLLIGKGFFTGDYKSNSVILEGLNSLEMFHDIVDSSETKSLPIFNRLYSFFHSNKTDFNTEFNELLQDK